MSNDLKSNLRWICVLPGAVLAGILATFPLHWILYLALAHDGATLLGFIEFSHGVDIEPIERMLYPCVIALVFILVGYKIAPKYKFKTALALFIAYVFSWSAAVLVALLKNGIDAVGVVLSGGTLLALLGAIIGLCVARRMSTRQSEE